LICFRLVDEDYLESAFSGDGARLYGGRWNAPGVAMVYTAQSLSLAQLELLVHLLSASLPGLSDDWWMTHVVDRLSFQQQRMVQERGLTNLE